VPSSRRILGQTTSALNNDLTAIASSNSGMRPGLPSALMVQCWADQSQWHFEAIIMNDQGLPIVEADVSWSAPKRIVVVNEYPIEGPHWSQSRFALNIDAEVAMRDR
jgi:hypothetical protein